MGVRMAFPGTDPPFPPGPPWPLPRQLSGDGYQACVLLVGLIFIAGELVSGLR